MTHTVENMAGQVFAVGGRVKHYDGWQGTIVEIVERFHSDAVLLRVKPDNMSLLPANQCWETIGGKVFCKPLEHGLSMGNYTPL